MPFYRSICISASGWVSQSGGHNLALKQTKTGVCLNNMPPRVSRFMATDDGNVEDNLKNKIQRPLKT